MCCSRVCSFDVIARRPKADVVTEGNACGAISSNAVKIRKKPINMENLKCTMLIGAVQSEPLCRRFPRRFAPRNDTVVRNISQIKNNS